MATIIKNGTVVTADLTYKADVKIEDGVITEIGPNLSGGDELDATGCYVMPGGVDGEQLAEIVKTTYPGPPVLLASGYRESANSAEVHGFKVLAKPYSRRDLAAEIRNTIDVGRCADA